VTNPSITDGGFENEPDDSFTRRITHGMDGWSHAGSPGSLRLKVEEAHPDIIEVAVKWIRPGHANSAVMLTARIAEAAEMVLSVRLTTHARTYAKASSADSLMAESAVVIAVMGTSARTTCALVSAVM